MWECEEKGEGKGEGRRGGRRRRRKRQEALGPVMWKRSWARQVTGNLICGPDSQTLSMSALLSDSMHSRLCPKERGGG